MQPREQVKTIFPMIYLLPTIILIEGFASIAVEILAIRQLLPFAGGSVIVTSLIIGIFLLFLALGYDWGGRVERNLHRVLRVNFFIAALLVGVGMSYLFVKLFFYYFGLYFGTSIIVPLVIYLSLIFAPSIFLLGQTLPIVMNIVRQNRSAVVIAGRALGLSTVGSFLGAVLTTLVLMHYFGVALTIMVVYASLMLLSMSLSQSRQSFLVIFALAFLSGIFIYVLNVTVEQRTFLLTTNHANYQILDHTNSRLQEGQKVLVINDLYSSLVTDDGHHFEYIERMRKILFDDMKLRDKDILVLGAGGFTLSQGDVGNNKFTYVDIDDQIRKAVEPYFIKQIKDKVVFTDARQYLLVNDKKFSAIVVDIYSDRSAIPAHLVTHQFMLSIKKHLTKNGVVLLNIIANPYFDNAYSKRIDNTIRSVFGSCAVIPLYYTNHPVNIIYACHNTTLIKDNVVYTDNKNTSTTDSHEW